MHAVGAFVPAVAKLALVRFCEEWIALGREKNRDRSDSDVKVIEIRKAPKDGYVIVLSPNSIVSDIAYKNGF